MASGQSKDRRSAFYASKWRKTEQAQVAVEYILLLVVAVSLATIMIKGLVSRTEGEEGVIVTKWREIIDYIGADPADEPE